MIGVEHVLRLLKLYSTTKMGWSPSPWRMKGSPKYFPPLSAYEGEYVAAPEKILHLTVSNTASIRTSEPEWASMKAVLQEEMETEIFQKTL